LIKKSKYLFAILFVTLFINGVAQSSLNKFRVFIGVGDNNLISDVVALSDKSFLGEVSGQIRLGVRIVDNYEINFGTYHRNYPYIEKYPGMKYNKFLGYSAGLTHEFRNSDSKWGMPLGIEVFKYQRNLDSTLSNGQTYFDHYSALSFGPKLGVRYHFSKNFFLETEINLLYESFKWNVDWINKSSLEANTFTTFKFFGISANICL
jgi:hypothetical protein